MNWQSESRRVQVWGIIAGHLETYGDLGEWLPDNWHVWFAFADKADALRARGREHYGARAIIEVLRYESALEDSGEPWKINNNQTARLARLYNAATATDFFETRDRA